MAANSVSSRESRCSRLKIVFPGCDTQSQLREKRVAKSHLQAAFVIFCRLALVISCHFRFASVIHFLFTANANRQSPVASHDRRRFELAVGRGSKSTLQIPQSRFSVSAAALNSTRALPVCCLFFPNPLAHHAQTSSSLSALSLSRSLVFASPLVPFLLHVPLIPTALLSSPLRTSSGLVSEHR